MQKQLFEIFLLTFQKDVLINICLRYIFFNYLTLLDFNMPLIPCAIKNRRSYISIFKKFQKNFINSQKKRYLFSLATLWKNCDKTVTKCDETCDKHCEKNYYKTVAKLWQNCGENCGINFGKTLTKLWQNHTNYDWILFCHFRSKEYLGPKCFEYHPVYLMDEICFLKWQSKSIFCRDLTWPKDFGKHLVLILFYQLLFLHLKSFPIWPFSSFFYFSSLSFFFFFSLYFYLSIYLSTSLYLIPSISTSARSICSSYMYVRYNPVFPSLSCLSASLYLSVRVCCCSI